MEMKHELAARLLNGAIPAQGWPMPLAARGVRFIFATGYFRRPR